MARTRPLLALAISVGAIVAAGCGSTSRGGSTDGRLDVVAAFYPLRFVAEQVGGDRISVTDLTPPGVEPHDLELTAADAARIQDADVVVYLKGFSPAVDDVVAAVAGDRALDVAAAARLTRAAPSNGDDDEGQSVRADPHFWLDPLRLADVADTVAAQLSVIDPDGAASYTANSATLRSNLAALDSEFVAGLADCRSTSLVTSHAAFGYLADRYGLTQIGITGLTPEDEPSPRDLAAVSRYVEGHDVTTVYYETLVSADIAATVAAETGAATAVLDPIEGLSSGDDGSGSAARDYLDIMRSNLATLRVGQGCP